VKEEKVKEGKPHWTKVFPHINKTFVGLDFGRYSVYTTDISVLKQYPNQTFYRPIIDPAKQKPRNIFGNMRSLTLMGLLK
jgi:hypothetical protein